MAYIGRQQDGFGVRSRFIYTATGGQTTFNTDDSGNALSYADSAYVDVYLNGVLLDPADYTATSLTSIVLGSGATASDILEVIVYDVFSVFSGTFTNGITANTATVTGDLTISDKIVHSDDTNTNIRFPAVDTVAIETAGSERTRVISDGKVLVAKTASNEGTVGIELRESGQLVATVDGGTPARFNRLTDDGAVIKILQAGVTDGQINTKSGDMAIGTGDTGLRFNDNLNALQPFNMSTNAFINNTVDLGTSGATFNEAYINGGVYIGGTGSANLLDDYEEGTWTPAYGFLTSGATITYDKANGEYVKIGRQVIARFQIRTDAFSGGSGNAVLGNLPFTAGTNASGGTGTAQRAGNLLVGYSTGFTTKAPQTGYVHDRTDYAILITNDSSDARVSLNDALCPSNFTDAANKNFLMGTVIFTV